MKNPKRRFYFLRNSQRKQFENFLICFMEFHSKSRSKHLQGDTEMAPENWARMTLQTLCNDPEMTFDLR